jgi:hypothetical protein
VVRGKLIYLENKEVTYMKKLCSLLILPLLLVLPSVWPAYSWAAGLTIGSAELLYTDAQLPFTMDGSFATVKRDASTMYFFHTEYDVTYKYVGPLSNPLQTKVWSKSYGTLWNMNGFSGVPWLYNIYKIDSTHWIGFIHKEIDSTYFSIGIGYTSNSGDHWVYCGDIIQPQLITGNIGGVPYVVVGDHFYVYFNEWTSGGSKRISVARALISDVVTAAQSNTVTTWYKYNSGSWNQNGLTGLGTNIVSGMTGNYDTHADAAYCSTLGKYILLLQTHGNGQLLLYTSSDGVSWGDRTVVDETDANNYIQAYSTIASLNSGANDDCSIVGSDFYVIFPRKDWPSNYDNDQLYRRRLTVSGAVTTHTVTPSVGSQGSILPNTPQAINDGSKATFTITAKSGYTVSVGGTCGGNLVGTTFTTDPVTTDCTVIASFSQIPANTPGSWVEAESGVLSSPMQIYSDASASGGRFVATSTDNSGYARYDFYVTTPGAYYLSVKILARDTNTNSFWVGLDSELAQNNDLYTYDATLSSSYMADPVSRRGSGGPTHETNQNIPMTWNLSSGSHSVYFYGRELGTRLDSVMLVPYAKAWNITTSAPDGHGTLACTTPVNSGQKSTCSAYPSSGYSTSSISGCGGSWSGGNNYTTGAITADCTVTSTFVRRRQLSR